MIHKSRALNFAFRKLELNTIHNIYSTESPFKYYMSNFKDVCEGPDAMLILLI